MSDDKITYLKQWFYKADEDFIVIKHLTEDEFCAPGAICFHCQQAAEKYLKAFLIFHGIEFPKTHNVEFLLVECSKKDQRFNDIDPKGLSDFGVAVRYPDDFYIPSENETRQYIRIAENIKELVMELIWEYI